jgi:hypothetical protein
MIGLFCFSYKLRRTEKGNALTGLQRTGYDDRINYATENAHRQQGYALRMRRLIWNLKP